MAKSAITVQQLSGPFAGDMDDLTFAAGDAENGNYFTFTGKEIIIAYNSDATNPYDVTLTSVDDPYGRDEDIVKEVAAEEYAIFEASDLTGWRQSGGQFYVTVENAAVLVAVIRLKN